MGKKVLVKNGRLVIEQMIEEYKKEIYRYNTLIRSAGYYLKPLHIVVKRFGNEQRTYYYIGRYWWKIVYAGKKGKTSKVKWIYIGREKPMELRTYPDPPPNPLDGLRFYVVGNDIVIDKRTYERYRWVFEGLEVEEAK